MIDKGSVLESKWAVYAALRTGDISVLPRVERLLAAGDRELDWAIALELQSATDPRAVPDLIEILKTAKSEIARNCVLMALGETLKDPRAIPTLAIHLSDPDRAACYYSLHGLSNITHEDACACQRKVEMSGFSQDRNVRFHDFLQGCSAGTWYLGLLLFVGLGVRSAGPGGRRPEGLADGRTGSGQGRRCR